MIYAWEIKIGRGWVAACVVTFNWAFSMSFSFTCFNDMWNWIIAQLDGEGLDGFNGIVKRLKVFVQLCHAAYAAHILKNSCADRSRTQRKETNVTWGALICNLSEREPLGGKLSRWSNVRVSMQDSPSHPTDARHVTYHWYFTSSRNLICFSRAPYNFHHLLFT